MSEERAGYELVETQEQGVVWLHELEPGAVTPARVETRQWVGPPPPTELELAEEAERRLALWTPAGQDLARQALADAIAVQAPYLRRQMIEHALGVSLDDLHEELVAWMAERPEQTSPGQLSERLRPALPAKSTFTTRRHRTVTSARKRQRRQKQLRSAERSARPWRRLLPD